VINIYFKKYLAEMDQQPCHEEHEQICSGFLSSFFWQSLTNEKNDNKTLQGTYNYGNVSRWARKLSGKDIFNLNNIFVPININNQHWTCIVIFMKEKWIQYYDSYTVGAGKSHMDIILKYLIDEDKRQQRIKPDEWALVTSTKSVPQQENKFDCGAFICMFGYFISQDTSSLFNQANVTRFRKQMAFAAINLANHTYISIIYEDPEVQANSAGASPSSLNDNQEIEPVGCNVSQSFPDHKILSSTNDGV
jgi:Ulp1 family protease